MNGASGYAPELPRLQWDARLGGIPRLVLATDAELMQVPESIVKTVVFLGARKGNGIYIGGTGFLVYAALPGTTLEMRYLITAAHVIEEITKITTDGKIYIRVNLLNAGMTLVETQIAHWVRHTDDKIDLAGIVITGEGQIDHMYFGLSSTATDEVIAKESIRAGTDLVFPGLFTRHIGNSRNIPIVRTGTIAAMPADMVATSRGPMRAYLAEARSIGGLSGSPVFCVSGPIHVAFEEPKKISYGNMTYYLFGVVHGHYGVKESNWDSSDPDSIERNSVNMGIAILTPAKYILTLLEQPEFEVSREQHRQWFNSEQARKLPEAD